MKKTIILLPKKSIKNHKQNNLNANIHPEQITTFLIISFQRAIAHVHP